jgi:hypothetical protein
MQQFSIQIQGGLRIMKITLWQQFSSNHSADYTIVGVFATEEVAKHASETIRKMVVEVQQWIIDNPNLSQTLRSKPTPIEEQYAQKYDFDWQEGLDWFQFDYRKKFREMYRRNPEDNITYYRNLVFVTDPGDSVTHQTGHQFAHLIQALNGKAFSDIYEGTPPPPKTHQEIFQNIFIDMKCIAPDLETANTIFLALETHLSEKTVPLEIQIPWVKFNPRFAHYMSFAAIDEYEVAEQQWIKEQNAWMTYWRENSEKYAHEEWQEQRSRFVKQDDVTISAIRSIHHEVTFYTGSVHIDETVITLKSLSGSNTETVLPALLSWMAHHDCTVSLKFEQKE